MAQDQPSTPRLKFWQEQCAAIDYVRHFGLATALDYIVGEKLVNFLDYSELPPDHAADLPSFVAEILRQFTSRELRDYLDRQKRQRRGTHRRRALLRQARQLLLPFEDN